jgi:hypothetical protein
MARGGRRLGRGARAGGAGAGRGLRGHPAVRAAQRAWPVLLEAYRRWDRLPQEQQERYRRMAAEYARRGRELARRPRGRGGR